MAFSEVTTITTVPGKKVTLGLFLTVDANYCLVYPELADDLVRPWGEWIFTIYVPSPVDKQSNFLTLPCYNQAQIVFHPFSLLSGLNCVQTLYTGKYTAPISVTLFQEL